MRPAPINHGFKVLPERDSRCIGLLDSRVTLGAAAKGRSSSYAISRVLQGSLGYIIGGNLYPGGFMFTQLLTEQMTHLEADQCDQPLVNFQPGS